MKNLTVQRRAGNPHALLRRDFLKLGAGLPLIVGELTACTREHKDTFKNTFGHILYRGDGMKRLVALDTIKNRKIAIEIKNQRPIIEPLAGNERHTHVLTYSHHDSHTHPMLYSLFFGALDPVMLNESTDREEILGKLRKRASEKEGPIVAYEYKLTAGLTSKDLEEFDGLVLLVDSSMHSGVANGKLLAEIMKRKTQDMVGDFSHEGISEDYQFIAIAVVEDQVKDLGVEESVKWIKNRMLEGTTSMEEKIILTETEWEIFKEATRRIKEELRYQPVTAVYVAHDVFVKNPRKYALEAESLGIRVGVKWVGDGGLGSKTAALQKGSYVDGSKGHLTIPINYQDPKAVQVYLKMLRDNGITDLACHAIGDKTIGVAIDLFSRFKSAGITMSIEHFELPTIAQIYTAATLGIPLNMQLNYATEVWRYEPWMGALVGNINPMRSILDIYSQYSGTSIIKFGTDGMPQSMLWAIACGVNHPIESQRITLAEAIGHSKDADGRLLLTKEAYGKLRSIDLKQATENREASSAELDQGVELVYRDRNSKS